MADTHETIADIIAWLRRPREGENAYLTAWRDEIADRLDAAHKRERGDCAKLREALMEIRRAMMKDSGAGPATELHATIDAITQAALAAPATTAPMRNCDRFATVDEAMEYHKRTNCAARRYCAYRDGCPTDGSCVVNWLLAKATEGGAK